MRLFLYHTWCLQTALPPTHHPTTLLAFPYPTPTVLPDCFCLSCYTNSQAFCTFSTYSPAQAGWILPSTTLLYSPALPVPYLLYSARLFPLISFIFLFILQLNTCCMVTLPRTAFLYTALPPPFFSPFSLLPEFSIFRFLLILIFYHLTLSSFLYCALAITLPCPLPCHLCVLLLLMRLKAGLGSPPTYRHCTLSIIPKPFCH